MTSEICAELERRYGSAPFTLYVSFEAKPGEPCLGSNQAIKAAT